MAKQGSPILEIKNLQVFYGQSHAVQGVDLTLNTGVLSVVGRNGMGKTTLCKAIMGLVPVSGGTIQFNGKNIVGSAPGEIARSGIGYVPQGRRLWRSLTVDEHLQLMVRPGTAWTVDRIYSVFPRLAERKNNGGAQLSGGEQQMLAISRALLLGPKLLVMDEPTEGLAPVIVDQVAEMLKQLGQQGDIHVLVIEQNIGVATSVSEEVAIMVNGRISRVLDSALLYSDRELQQRLLGVGRHTHDEPEAGGRSEERNSADQAKTVKRIYLSNPRIPTQWSRRFSIAEIENSARTVTQMPTAVQDNRILARRVGASDNLVVVAGAFDTKKAELKFIQDALREKRVKTRLVDLSTAGKPSGVEVPPHQVAAFHPNGASAVFTGNKSTANAAMGVAFERYLKANQQISGIISVAGAESAELSVGGLRTLPIGLPKVLVAPVRPSALADLVGGSDLIVIPSVFDIDGGQVGGRQSLLQAAGAVAAMVEATRATGLSAAHLPTLGITRSALVDKAFEQVRQRSGHFERLALAAEGVCGQQLEQLAAQGRLAAAVDLAMTDITDHLFGGLYPCVRFAESVSHAQMVVVALGGLDCIRVGAEIPNHLRGRQVTEYSPGKHVVRTTVSEAVKVGEWLSHRINDLPGEIRILLPEGGLSELGRAGSAFHDPVADKALFDAIQRHVRVTTSRHIQRVPGNINDPPFADAVATILRPYQGTSNLDQHGGRSYL